MKIVERTAAIIILGFVVTHVVKAQTIAVPSSVKPVGYNSLGYEFQSDQEVSPSDVDVESADGAFLRQVQDLVEQHIDNHNFGTDWLADEVGLSPRQLRRRIKALTRLSTTGFIRTLRLQRASQLLSQDAGTVAEIAYAVGFNDPKYFSRLFRQVYGVSPSEYEV